jgi:hypothetical protein
MQRSRSISFASPTTSDVTCTSMFHSLQRNSLHLLCFSLKVTCVPRPRGKYSGQIFLAPKSHKMTIMRRGDAGFAAKINSAGTGARTLHSRQHSHRVTKGDECWTQLCREKASASRGCDIMMKKHLPPTWEAVYSWLCIDEADKRDKFLTIGSARGQKKRWLVGNYG